MLTKVKKQIEGTKKPPYRKNNISYTQFSTYKACPKRWFKQYITKEGKSTQNINLTFGTALHSTLQHYLHEVYNTSVKKADTIDLDDMLLNHIITIYKTESKKQGKYNDKKEIGDYFADGSKILAYIKKNRLAYFSTKGIKWVGVELPIDVKIKGVHYTGFIDLVLYDELDKKFLVYDIKTSNKGWSSHDKKDDMKKAQLLIYKHALSEMYGIPIDSIHVQFLIARRNTESNSEYTIKPVQEFIPAQSKQSVKKALDLLEEFIDNVYDEKGEFIGEEQEAKPTKFNCTYCQFNKTCEDSMVKE